MVPSEIYGYPCSSHVLHKYHDIQHCFWLYPECNLEVGLREIRKDCDADIRDLCLASKHNNGEIEVFFDHPVILDECVIFSKAAVVDETVEGDKNSSVEIIGAKDPDEEEYVESKAEVPLEQAVEKDEEIPVEVPLEQVVEEDEDIPA
ncbi:hypothetical protein SESBI_48938 [Sesbania bispinosa]|nr:hypothetical protein SESBI_48938 [Sesbania bispinosa]